MTGRGLRWEIAGFFQGLDSGCTDMNLAPEHFVAQSDLVATFGRFWGTAKATGKRFDVPYAHSFTVRDGKVAEFANFGDTAALSSAFGSL